MEDPDHADSYEEKWQSEKIKMHNFQKHVMHSVHVQKECSVHVMQPTMRTQEVNTVNKRTEWMKKNVSGVDLVWSFKREDKNTN